MGIPLKDILQELERRGNVHFAAFDAKKEIKKAWLKISDASKSMSTGRKIAWNLYIKAPYKKVHDTMHDVDLVYENVLVDIHTVSDKFKEMYRKIYNDDFMNLFR